MKEGFIKDKMSIEIRGETLGGGGCKNTQGYTMEILKHDYKIQRVCELEFTHCFFINYTYAECKVTLFIKHFLISPFSMKEVR